MKQKLYFFLAAYSLLAACFLGDYLSMDLGLLAGLALLPYIYSAGRSGVRSYRYLLLVIVTGALYYKIPVLTLHFFLLVAAALLAVESLAGKSSYLPLLLLAVVSPFFRYLSGVFSFPLRLKLSALAGGIIETMGYEVQVNGNLMSLNGADFTVDEACAGLKMLGMSFMLLIFLLAHAQKRSGKAKSPLALALFLLLTLALNMVSNLIRIVLLVLLGIGPDSPLHYCIGLLCLVAYVLLPLHLLLKRSGKTDQFTAQAEVTAVPATSYALNALVLAGVALAPFLIEPSVRTPVVIAPGLSYTESRLPEGITRLEDSRTLIYIKSIPGFYSAEHSPLLCWKGSGYTFRNFVKAETGTTLTYRGLLEKDAEKLYTAWYYDNGIRRTIDQMDWRIDMLKGSAPYYLVNVTAATEEDLSARLEELLRKPLIVPPAGKG
jgi:exosortase N